VSETARACVISSACWRGRWYPPGATSSSSRAPSSGEVGHSPCPRPRSTFWPARTADLRFHDGPAPYTHPRLPAQRLHQAASLHPRSVWTGAGALPDGTLILGVQPPVVPGSHRDALARASPERPARGLHVRVPIVRSPWKAGRFVSLRQRRAPPLNRMHRGSRRLLDRRGNPSLRLSRGHHAPDGRDPGIPLRRHFRDGGGVRASRSSPSVTPNGPPSRLPAGAV